mmetsp:Transcript_17735/g.21382  ORF Transcript_17735/g.21382 Transcript_17735/m.21382 type:complete len:124 (+) Transcript_17735:210-581(+)
MPFQPQLKGGSPVFMLVIDIPGGKKCRWMGKMVFSDMELVRQLESEFVPLLIQNNTAGGHDKKIVAKMGEKQWGEPVIRFLDPDEKDIIPRVTGYFSKAATKMRIRKVLKIWEDRMEEKDNKL